MKFFSSLFKEKEIHIAPGEKIIPAKEFSTLQEAIEILNEAKDEAVKFKEQTLEECDVLKEEAKSQGFDEGLKQLNEHILQLDETLKTIKEDLKKKILPLALKAAKKIVGEELKINPERITDIVIQALKPVLQHHRVKIYVNKEDLAHLEKDKQRIKSVLEQIESFSILERSDIKAGGCIIETESGIINAQLENQWRAIESAFEKFMNK